ncbi:DUF1740-domain-containing protein [Aspergillus steynii IBT 23096]|uniref:DUF1740-domain-containing protein n=1 Tax=Aspergillus steynii IBT 23096 TaxID=1392250 RepID=A0A2I2GB61_9EURO|nr:DUF1740-domain-containing protein [Aspergillus steynii IBT 23096]PLB50123.1 DUF1740-domain-containing protein [Aspergillus steynii IBT 23096]
MSPSLQEEKPIPRFASFKPPPAPPPADRKEREEKESTRHRSSHHSRHRSHRDRSRSKERRRDREHRERDRREHRHARREPEPRRRETPREPTEDRSSKSVKVPEDEVQDLYVIDRKGDKYNLVYGTIHRYSIPLYHRVGRGSVLGLPPNYKIDRDTADGDALVVRTDAWRSDTSKTKSKRVLAGLNKQRPKLLRIRQPSSPDEDADADKDYLPLNSSSSRRRQATVGEIESDDEKHAYRSIHGKAKPEDDIPSDLEAVSDSGSSDDEAARVDPDEEIKQRNVELTRSVETNPTNVGTWLQLINHQETLLLGAGRESRALTYAEKQSLADIKLSLYDKALKRSGQNPVRDRLLLGRLEEGAKLWDTKKLSAQWQAVLKSNSQFISLWIKYLDFRQTEFLDFTYERCLSTFLECLKLNRSAPDNPGKVHVQIYLFLRLTVFIRESGFTEHAVGLWQAILEFTFFSPPRSDADSQALVRSFLDFWDSEAARIGEVGAKGWANGGGTPPDPATFTPISRVHSKAIFKTWEVCERERIFNARLPGRSLDESEDDDPFRVILPSDLEEIVSLFWDMNSPEELADAFLIFCQLPPLISARNLETTACWVGDSFLQNYLVNSAHSTLEDWLPSSSASTDQPILFPHQKFIHTLQTLFADQGTWFASLKSWAHATSLSRSDIDPDWVRRVLKLLVEAMPLNEHLAEYTVAVDFACNNKDAKKYAKSLLKKRSSSLRLYNCYALIERRSGNLAAADHVWATSLSMSKTFAEKDRAKNVLLWHAWIWELLEARNTAHASHLLLSMPDNSIDLKAFPDPSSQPTISPTSFLKIQSCLSGTQETALAAGAADVLSACTDCLAILFYLTNSLDLVKSQEAYLNAIHRLTSMPSQIGIFRPFAIQLLHQSRARLLYHHVRTSTLYKPSYIRTLLTESISLFPHNTMFLSLFAWNESRFRIEERVRDTIRDITTHPRNTNASGNTHDLLATSQVPITSHLFSIYTELSRPVHAGSTIHSGRAAFEKAITDQDTSSSTLQPPSTARSNLTLWKLYVLFELSHHDIPRAKDVFYRGMRACPWAKELVMLAFSHLRADLVRDLSSSSRQDEGMGFDELRRVYNVLVEKELRIHVDIEDLLDEVAAKMQGRAVALGVPITMPEDAESGDEIMGV